MQYRPLGFQGPCSYSNWGVSHRGGDPQIEGGHTHGS